MNKKEVAAALDRIAIYLELKGDNPFRVRAFQNSARIVSGIPGDIAEALASGSLADRDGIGKGTLDVVTELVVSGTSSLLSQLEAEIPKGLLEMRKISGLGVAKIKTIHEALGIETIDELEQAAADGRLAALPRFGARTAANIIKGISYLRRTTESRLFHHALGEARALTTVLERMPGVAAAEIAGSVRRRCETIDELHFVLTVPRDAAAIVDRLNSIEGVSEFQARSPRTVTLKFGTGTVANLTLSDPDNRGWDLVRATGSELHLAELGAHARAGGLAWGDRGPEDERLTRCSSEAEFYGALGLQFIPPELREGGGEVAAAARHQLPRLLERSDLQGFVHCHTNYSDGTSTVAEWAAMARAQGYAYVGITDHSIAATYAGGLSPDDITAQHAEVDRVNREQDDVRVLKGVEADVLADGSPDYDAETRARFEFIIASVHNRFNMAEREMTDRILKALDDPSVAILGHPTGRMLLSRDPYPMDLDAVLQKTADVGVAVEINSDPQRLDLDWRSVRRALELGVTISIGADAHSIHGADNVDLGVGIARKGWVSSDRVLNAGATEEFLEHARARRSR